MRQPETNAFAQPPDRKDAAEEAELSSREFCALLGQIGPPEGLWGCLTAHLPPDAVHSGNSLRVFLEAYQTQVLVPLEMPAITRARSHAARGHLRELIALDRDLDTQPVLPAFASASCRIGRAQLERLRPLRDERTVQRYLAAVEAGQAAGWHTVVYGMTLAIYSWPLRHGLLTYARQTLSGLALAAGRPPGLAGPAGGEILQTCFLRLPAAIEETLDACGEVGELARAL